MDFGTLLHTAQKTVQQNKKEIKYYSTKFEPPKKEQRNKKTLSANVKKFLERKEAEERQRAEEARRKKEELLALRAQDKKASRRVNVMLKRTKSANQSVIDDAVDKNNTAVTLAGPCQPDEDDYGYVSQEAAAFYNKMMEKYSQMPDEPKFPLGKKKVSTNLNSTRDRVQAALEREKEEALLPHKRKRKRKEEEEDAGSQSPEAEEKPVMQQKSKPKAPPPMNFAELLKIAEQKQHQPIMIEKKEVEEERPLTKKQKKEQERIREWQERKERHKVEGDRPQVPGQNRIPKLNGSVNSDRPAKSNEAMKTSKPIVKPEVKTNGALAKLASSAVKMADGAKLNGALSKGPSSTKPDVVSSDNRYKPTTSSKLAPSNPKSDTKLARERTNEFAKDKMQSLLASQKTNGMRPPEKYVPTNKPSLPQKSSSNFTKPAPPRPLQKLDTNHNQSRPVPKEMSTKPRPTDTGKRPLPQSDLRPTKKLEGRPKEFPPRDLKPKQFPPPDVRRREFPPKDVRRKPVVNKRRILDDDDEEYDSEMDDFIDDGPQEEEDYSKHISEIFGYNKAKYRDYEDDDIDNMESSFSQQMKEEIISTKIGIMEDLEDMRMEEQQKRRKAMLKKNGRL